MKIRMMAVALGLALSVSACGGSDPLGTTDKAADGKTVVVGSANFPESELLAEIYAGALEAKGVKVSKKLNIGSRETYVPALENGEINVLPEYTGAFAVYLDKAADVKDEA
ncbi:MAG TPA: glycine betaine ABC transporter substrate-binding protein, partial [Marmoricola sp.]|nr:glycine betaine ABC transporter substrate-binding protein [Marmoricola sp.]